jgi:hypothetical protein
VTSTITDTDQQFRFYIHWGNDIILRGATQNNVPQHYIGHLWKGLHPAAVQVWPWHPSDVLELGEVVLGTGCEAHNGNHLLRAAEFRPVSVTYIPRGAAFVIKCHECLVTRAIFLLKYLLI